MLTVNVKNIGIITNIRKNINVRQNIHFLIEGIRSESAGITTKGIPAKPINA